MDEFQLRFGKNVLTGFDKAVISLSLGEIAGEFSFKIPNRLERDRPLVLPANDTEVEISVNSKPIMKGFVEVVENFASDQEGFISLIRGREITCDLVDSSITYSKQLSGPIDSVIGEIVKPFGIKTISHGSKKVSMKTEKGQSVWDTIEILARKTGDLLWTIGDGVIHIGVGERPRYEKSLSMQNIKSAHSKFSSHETFSEYIVVAEKDSSSDSWGAASKKSVKVKGESLRYRPLVIKGEISSLDAAEAMKRAEWEASIRVARAAMATVSIAGFRIGTDLARVNGVTFIDHPMIGLQRDMLIASVMYSYSRIEGSTTTLGLNLPDAFKPKPADGIKARGESNQVKGWS
jgi:prophage tail gpP-like protein